MKKARKNIRIFFANVEDHQDFRNAEDHEDYANAEDHDEDFANAEDYEDRSVPGMLYLRNSVKTHVLPDHTFYVCLRWLLL